MSDQVDILPRELFANHLTEDFGPLLDRRARGDSTDQSLDAHGLQGLFHADPVREAERFDGRGTDVVEACDRARSAFSGQWVRMGTGDTPKRP